MRGSTWNPWLFSLGVLLAALMVCEGRARADITSDQSGSIIVFPKVIADGTRDTLIQISNTSNSLVFAHCYYLDATGFCTLPPFETCNLDSDCPLPPVGGTPNVCQHLCQAIPDFDIHLTAQQPTVWEVSEGRSLLSLGGLSPGQILPKGRPRGDHPTLQPFIGSLTCVQTDTPGGSPVAGNALKGEATIVGTGFGQISEYNAIGIVGNGAATNPLTLNFNGIYECVGGTNNGNSCDPGDPNACPSNGTPGVCTPQGEYNACPASLVTQHWAEGATDTFTGRAASTELTLVPCTQLLEQAVPTRARALFDITTETEQRLTTSLTFDCFVNRRLSDIPDVNSQQFSAALGSAVLKTRIKPPGGKICYTGNTGPTTTCTDDTDCCSDGTTSCLPQVGLCSNANVGCAVASDCNFGSCVAGLCADNANLVCTTSADCAGTCNGTQVYGCLPWSGLLGVSEEFQTSPALRLVPQTGTAAVNLHTEGTRPGDVIVLPLR